MSILERVRACLAETDPDAKADGAEGLWQDWQELLPAALESPETSPLERPGCPDRPILTPPENMPRRELSGPSGHAALIHALTHIEFSAINLALDAVQRFVKMPADFHADWLRVAAEEALHFRLLRDHLRKLGHEYGDFPAHAGLWSLAEKTAWDPLARMALVPRLMEARGLDVTPGIQNKLRGYGDKAGASILDIILRDEIGHVAAGDRWFRYLCSQRGLEPESAYAEQIQRHAAPPPRPPFNMPARLRAGFSVAELEKLGGAG